MHAYVELHRRGHAHSVEVYEGDELVGGLYGVTFGGFFGGESMFHRRTDASKAAVAYLVEHLRARGFRLLDAQVPNPHLISLGAVEIPRREYLARLRTALAQTGHVLRRTPVVMMSTRVPARSSVRAAALPSSLVVTVWLATACASKTSPKQSGTTRQVDDLRARVLRTLSHDRNAFTQGLVYHEGKLYESTGLVGRSSLRRVDPDTGRVEQSVAGRCRRSSARGWPGWAASWSS